MDEHVVYHPLIIHLKGKPFTHGWERAISSATDLQRKEGQGRGEQCGCILKRDPLSSVQRQYPSLSVRPGALLDVVCLRVISCISSAALCRFTATTLAHPTPFLTSCKGTLHYLFLKLGWGDDSPRHLPSHGLPPFLLPVQGRHSEQVKYGQS